MNEDAALDSIRDDPRFQAMKGEMAADMAQQLADVRKLEASGEIVLPPNWQKPTVSGGRQRFSTPMSK